MGAIAKAKEARRQALDEVRALIMSLQPDESAICESHKIGFRHGHASARYAARDLITEMLSSVDGEN